MLGPAPTTCLNLQPSEAKALIKESALAITTAVTTIMLIGSVLALVSMMGYSMGPINTIPLLIGQGGVYGSVAASALLFSIDIALIVRLTMSFSNKLYTRQELENCNLLPHIRHHRVGDKLEPGQYQKIGDNVHLYGLVLRDSHDQLGVYGFKKEEDRTAFIREGAYIDGTRYPEYTQEYVEQKWPEIFDLYTSLEDKQYLVTPQGFLIYHSSGRLSYHFFKERAHLDEKKQQLTREDIQPALQEGYYKFVEKEVAGDRYTMICWNDRGSIQTRYSTCKQDLNTAVTEHILPKMLLDSEKPLQYSPAMLSETNRSKLIQKWNDELKNADANIIYPMNLSENNRTIYALLYKNDDRIQFDLFVSQEAREEAIEARFSRYLDLPLFESKIERAVHRIPDQVLGKLALKDYSNGNSILMTVQVRNLTIFAVVAHLESAVEKLFFGNSRSRRNYLLRHANLYHLLPNSDYTEYQEVNERWALTSEGCRHFRTRPLGRNCPMQTLDQGIWAPEPIKLSNTTFYPLYLRHGKNFNPDTESKYYVCQEARDSAIAFYQESGYPDINAIVKVKEQLMQAHNFRELLTQELDFWDTPIGSGHLIIYKTGDRIKYTYRTEIDFFENTGRNIRVMLESPESCDSSVNVDDQSSTDADTPTA